MTETWISPTQIFDGHSLLGGHAIRLDDGKVCDVRPLTDLPSTVQLTALEGTISAGFIDLQVNGGGGASCQEATEAALVACAAGDRPLRRGGGSGAAGAAGTPLAALASARPGFSQAVTLVWTCLTVT